MKLPLKEFFRPQAIFNIPAGIVPDPVGAWGIFGLIQNVNNYAEQLSSVATAGTTGTLIAAGSTGAGSNTPGNILAGFVQLNAGATGGFTATFPATSSIIAALGNTVAQDGSYTEPVHFVNNSGVTVTLAAGDANAAILGSTTIAAGSVRKLLMRVLNSSNVTFTNVGTWTL